MVVAMQCLGLTVLHVSATATADHLVFYSFSLKVSTGLPLIQLVVVPKENAARA
jgi:hypothetical protein